jgi:hypothetical protein
MEPRDYLFSGGTTTYMDLVIDATEYLNSSRNGVDLRTVYARKNLGLTNKKVHPYDKHEELVD